VYCFFAAAFDGLPPLLAACHCYWQISFFIFLLRQKIEFHKRVKLIQRKNLISNHIEFRKEIVNRFGEKAFLSGYVFLID